MTDKGEIVEDSKMVALLEHFKDNGVVCEVKHERYKEADSDWVKELRYSLRDQE